MSSFEQLEYEESLVARAEEIADYFTSKPPEQIVEQLISRAKKNGATDDWERLEAYVRELESIRYINEYRPYEVDHEGNEAVDDKEVEAGDVQ